MDDGDVSTHGSSFTFGRGRFINELMSTPGRGADNPASPVTAPLVFLAMQLPVQVRKVHLAVSQPQLMQL